MKIVRILIIGWALCLVQMLAAQSYQQDTIPETVVTATGTLHLLKNVPVQTEVILSNLFMEISEHLNAATKLSDKKISSLLYHSSLYRRSKGAEKNEFKSYFPTISSFTDASLEKEGDTYDA